MTEQAAAMGRIGPDRAGTAPRGVPTEADGRSPVLREGAWGRRTTGATVGTWINGFALTLGIWVVSYLVRQWLTMSSGVGAFSPFGSFGQEGAALAVVGMVAVIAWGIGTLVVAERWAATQTHQALPPVSAEFSGAAGSVPLARIRAGQRQLARALAGSAGQSSDRGGQRDQTGRWHPGLVAIGDADLRRGATPLTLKEVSTRRRRHTANAARQRAA